MIRRRASWQTREAAELGNLEWVAGSTAIGCWSLSDTSRSLQVGSGIVADPDPDAEYRECLDKASALLATLQDFQESPEGS